MTPASLAILRWEATADEGEPSQKEQDMTKRVLIFAGLALSLLVPPAASYAQPGATLYELSERVTRERRVDVERQLLAELSGSGQLLPRVQASAASVA